MDKSDLPDQRALLLHVMEERIPAVLRTLVESYIPADEFGMRHMTYALDQQKELMGWADVPLDIKAHELHAKVLLALVAAARGWGAGVTGERAREGGHQAQRMRAVRWGSGSRENIAAWNMRLAAEGGYTFPISVSDFGAKAARRIRFLFLPGIRRD